MFPISSFPFPISPIPISNTPIPKRRIGMICGIRPGVLALAVLVAGVVVSPTLRPGVPAAEAAAEAKGDTLALHFRGTGNQQSAEQGRFQWTTDLYSLVTGEKVGTGTNNADLRAPIMDHVMTFHFPTVTSLLTARRPSPPTRSTLASTWPASTRTTTSCRRGGRVPMPEGTARSRCGLARRQQVARASDVQRFLPDRTRPEVLNRLRLAHRILRTWPQVGNTMPDAPDRRIGLPRSAWTRPPITTGDMSDSGSIRSEHLCARPAVGITRPSG